MLNGSVACFDDNYTNEELIQFMQKEKESMKSISNMKCDLKNVFINEPLFEKNNERNFKSVQFHAPSDEEIIRYIKSL